MAQSPAQQDDVDIPPPPWASQQNGAPQDDVDIPAPPWAQTTGDKLRAQAGSQEPADQQIILDAAAASDRRDAGGVDIPPPPWSNVGREYPDRVPPTPPAPVVSPEEAQDRQTRELLGRNAKNLKIENFLPSARPPDLPPASAVPFDTRPTPQPTTKQQREDVEPDDTTGVSPLLFKKYLASKGVTDLDKPELRDKLGIDRRAAAERAAVDIWNEKDPNNPQWQLEHETALNQIMRRLRRDVGSGFMAFSDEATAHSFSALDDAFKTVMEPESWEERYITQPTGTALGFFEGAGVRAAQHMVGEIVGREAVKGAIEKGLAYGGGRALATKLASEVGTEAATMGVASAITHAGDYGRAQTFEEAWRDLGQHAAGGIEMGAIFGGAKQVAPGGWRTVRGMLDDLGELRATRMEAPLEAPPLAAAFNEKALQSAARIGVGSVALLASDAAHGSLNLDDMSKTAFDIASNILFLAAGGAEAHETFVRNAQADGKTPIEALQEIRVRRVGDDYVVEQLRPDSMVPAPGAVGAATDILQPQGRHYQPIARVKADTLRDTEGDWAAGLNEAFPENKNPVATSTPDDWSAGLDEVFGDAGKDIAKRAADARNRILGTDQDPEIAIRGVDIRGKIGEPGWEKNRMLMNDLAAVGASHLWRGDRTMPRFSRQMVQEFGDGVRPQLDRIYADAQDLTKKSAIFDLKDMPTVRNVLSLFHAGGKITPESAGLNPAEWYDKAWPYLKQRFGRNADLYAQVLAATSANTQVASNISLANRAMGMILTGERNAQNLFKPGKKQEGADGFMEAHANNLNRVLQGLPLEGPKVEPFGRALRGDRTAIVIDTWMLRAFGLGDDTSDAKVRLIQGAIARMAREFGMDERQVQAQIWAGVKRKAEGKDTPLAPIDRMIEARLDMLRPHLERMSDDIARRAPDAGRDPMVDRLAGLVGRGKANGIEPDRMYRDFTSRGADPAVAAQAIRIHFPDFGGENEGTQAAPARGTEAATAGQPPAAAQPEAREAGAGGGIERPRQPAPAEVRGPEVRQSEQQRQPVPGGPGGGEPAGGPGVPARAGAEGPVGPVGGPAHVPGRPGIPAGESRLRTVFPRAGAAVATDSRLQPYVDVLRPHQAEDASLILRGLDGEQAAYGLFNGAGSGKTYVALTALDVHRRMGSRALYVAPANVLQIDPKTGALAGTILEAAAKLGTPLKVWDGKGPLAGDAIHVMTYEKWKKLAPDPNAVVYFDEAHYLKNVETAGPTARATHGAEWMRTAKGVILGTATPLDKSIHIPYLERLGVYEGKTKEEALAGLGIVAEQGRNGLYFKSLNEAETTQKIEALFERLGTRGLMSSRWIHMDEIPVYLKNIAIDNAAMTRMSERMLRGYGVGTADELTGVYKMHYGENMRRQLEPYKIPATLDLIQKELADGRQVVVYVSRINKSIAKQPKKLGGRAMVESAGTAETLKAFLQVRGINDISDLHGNSDQEKAEAVADFQSGKSRVLIATPESGSTGINLDADKEGMAPRTTIVMTAPYGGTENVQVAGRTWRLNTQSLPRYYYLDSGHSTDSRNLDIVAGKLRTLGAVVQTDTAAKIANPEIAQRADKGPAPAKFYAMWSLKKGVEPLELWNLTEDIPGHPKGSTLERSTLEGYGYEVPPRPENPPGEIARRGGISSGWIDWNGKDESAPGSAVHAQLLKEHPEWSNYTGDTMLQNGAIRYVDEGGDHVSIELDPRNRIAVETALRSLGRLWKDYPSVLIEYHDREHAPFTPKTQPEPFPSFIGDRRGAQADLRKYLEENGGIARRTDTEERAKFQTRAFRKWFGGSRVVDADGAPLTVYHGTTHDFQEFGPQRANTENAFGKGYYFSTDPLDAGHNYGSEPDGETTSRDLENRITARAEQIDAELTQERGDAETPTNQEIWKQAHDQATSELYGGHPNIMPVFLALKDPVVLQKNGGTRFTIFSDEDGTKEWGNGVKLFDAIQSVGDEMGFDGRKAWEHLTSRDGLDETPAYDVWKLLQDAPEIQYLEDQDGRLAGYEAIRRIFEEVGHDGIELRDANEEYPGFTNMEPGTSHYIAFRPNQIKSAIGNKGTWSVQTGDITRRDDGQYDPKEPGAPSPAFYLKAEKVVEQKLQNNMKPEQIMATLRNNQVKEEELKWLGLQPWLESLQGKITKQQVLDFIRGSDLAPDVFMAGGPTPTGARPLSLIDTGPLEARHVQSEQELGDFKEEIKRKLEEGFERQNAIAKANRRRKKANMPKANEQTTLPGMEDEGTSINLSSEFKGFPGVFSTRMGDWSVRERRDPNTGTMYYDVLRPSGEAYMEGYRVRDRAEQVAAQYRNASSPSEIITRRNPNRPEYTLRADYDAPDTSRWVVRRGGEVIGRFGDENEAGDFRREREGAELEERNANRPGYPGFKLPQVWKVNARQEARKVFDRLMSIDPSAPEDVDDAQLLRRAEYLMGGPIQGLVGRMKELQAEEKDARAAFNKAAEANEKERRTQRLPQTKYGEYTVTGPGWSHYFEVGFHLKPQGAQEINALKARRDEIEAAQELMSNSRDPLPGDVNESMLPAGYKLITEPRGEPRWVEPITRSSLGSFDDADGNTIGAISIIDRTPSGEIRQIRPVLNSIYASNPNVTRGPVMGLDGLENAKRWVEQNAKVSTPEQSQNVFRAQVPTGEQSGSYDAPSQAIVWALNHEKTERYEQMDRELRINNVRLDELEHQSTLFIAPHFQNPFNANLLHHARGYLVTRPDGKRLLFVNEIQSDWSSKGRSEGWKLPPVTELPEDYKVEAIEQSRVRGGERDSTIVAKLQAANRDVETYPWVIAPGDLNMNRIKLYRSQAAAQSFVNENRQAGGDYGNAIVERFEDIRVRAEANRLAPENTEKFMLWRVIGPNDFKSSLFPTEADAREAGIAQANKGRRVGVALAPFVQKSGWVEHSMKWALRYAAEQGYDGITWATGEMNADLYNLRKAIDRLVSSIDPNQPNNYFIQAFKDSRQVWSGSLKESELSENLGQTLAERLKAAKNDPLQKNEYWVVPAHEYYEPNTPEYRDAVARNRRNDTRWLVIRTLPEREAAAPGTGPAGPTSERDLVVDYELSEMAAVQNVERMRAKNEVVLEGLDLEMGGEHHKALYNRMIPSIMGKYVKQWNGKVEDIPFVKEPANYSKPLSWKNHGGFYLGTQDGEQFASVNLDPIQNRWYTTITEGDYTHRSDPFDTPEEAKAYADRSFAARGKNRPEKYADMPGARPDGAWEAFDSRTGRVYQRFDTENAARDWVEGAQQVNPNVSFDYDQRNEQRGVEAIDREVDRIEEQRRLAAAAGRPYAEMQPLDQRLTELMAERDALRFPAAQGEGTIVGKHDEKYDKMQGVWLTPEMRESVLYQGQPLFREPGKITGEGVERGLGKSIPIPNTGVPFIDSLGVHTEALMREIADKPYMQAVTREVQTGIRDIARALSDLHENIQHADLKAMDIYIEGNTLAYNRVGMNQVFLNLQAHISRDLERNPDEDVPESVRRMTVARDIAKSLVWEVLRQAHPKALQAEMNARTKVAINRLKDRGSVYDDLVDNLQRALEGTNGIAEGSADARNLLARQAESESAGGPATGRGLEGAAGSGLATRPAVEGGPGTPPPPQPTEGAPGRERPAGVQPVQPVVPGAEGARPAATGPAGVQRPDLAATMAAAQAEATRAAIEYSRTVTAPPPPYTLGGGTVTRTLVGQNILTKLRKDRIIQDFGEALKDMGKGGLVLQGGIANKKALGQAHRLSGNVRLRYITDLDTAAHEFGHRLQDALGVRDQDLAPFAGELATLKALGTLQGPTLSEGWGEFWRMHATDPVTAARLAPNLYRWAEGRLSTEPLLDAAWQAFRNQTMELRHQNPIDRMASAIAWPDEKPTMTQQVRETMAISHLRSLVRANLFAYFDQTLPFRLVTEAVEKANGAPLPASKDPFKWSRTLSARVIDTVKGFQHEGVMDWATRQPVPGSRSFEAIVRDVAGSLRDFQTYEVLKRAQFLSRSNKPDGTPNAIHRATAAHLMRLGDIDVPARDTAIATLESSYPHFKGVLNDLQGWNKGLLKFMQDSGAYSADAIAAIEQANDLYVPLHRLMDPAGPGTWGSGESTVNVGRAIKRLGGRSERLVLPTLQTRMRQALMMVGTAERNYAGNVLFDAIKQIPNYGAMADEVPTPLQPTSFQLDDVKGAIKRAFQQSGQDPRVVDLVDMNKLATIFQPHTRDLPNNQVMVYVKGEPKIWQVHDPLLLRAATHMGPDEARAFAQSMGLMSSLLYKMVKFPAKAIQFNVVHGIDFLVGHLVRSAQEQGLQGYMLPPVLRGVKDLATGGRVKERYLSGGGRVFNFEDYSPEGIQKSLDRLGYTSSNPFNPQYWYEGGVKRPMSDLLSVLDAAGRLFDEPARVGVAKLAYDNPRAVDTTELDKIVEAAFRGRESGLDFNQRGGSQLFNRYLSLVPFSHAVATGLYRNLRNYRQGVGAISNEGLKAIFGTVAGHPERRYARGLVMYGGIMMLSALYNEWANHDDPRYQALTDQEKTGYFHFLPPWERRFTAEEWETMTPDEQVKYGSPFIKVSKPWWPGFFQATLPAEILQGALNQEQTASQTLQKVWGSFLQSSRIDAMPTAIRVPLELALNRQNIMTLGSKPRPITPDFQMKLEPSKRYGPGTQETTKQIAAALRQIPGLSDMSPRDVEYLTRSFGYLPMYAVDMAETMEQAFGGKDMPEPPAKRWGEYPGVQRFVQRFPESHPQVVNDIDAIYKQSTQVAATYKQKVADRDPDVPEYLEMHRMDLAVAPLTTAWARHMKDMWKQVDRIKLDKNLTGEEKRQRIDLLFLDVLNQSNRTMARINDLKRVKD